jgi:hypothetical protein
MRNNSPSAFAGRVGSIALPGFEPRTGGHCESSAILNALSYLGYGLSEADIVGGGGAPAFLFTNDAFPFIGGRNEEMRENFLAAAGIPFEAVIPESDDGDWKGIAARLEGGLPLLLRVDMRWLPYLYGGKYGSPYMSFGGHWICLFGIDFGAAEALVTDTANIGPRSVKLGDLDKARSSTTKTFPPRGEYAWIEPKPAAWSLDPDALAKSALATVLGNYDASGAWPGTKKKPLVGLAGLEAFPGALAAIHEMVPAYMLASAYSYMAGSIERNGTGGAAFRRLFRDFLVLRAADCAEESVRAACASLVKPTEAAMAAWSGLALAFDQAAARLGSARGPGRKSTIAASEAETAELARAVYSAEALLRDGIAAAKF